MIYCVWFSEVETDLNGRGFKRIFETSASVVFSDGTTEVVIRHPSVSGKVTEITMNDAFDAAGLVPPSLDFHYCD